ncbi:MAG TPA: RpiB/LacA/LacB family sugar-phosphate isomerase, partial [Pirellulales bacterium]
MSLPGFAMKIAIGCDHRGFSVKTKLIEAVARLGHEVVDVGAFSNENCDYPD